MVRNGSRDFHNEIVDLAVSEERAAARLEYSGTPGDGLRGGEVLDPTVLAI